MTASSAQVPPAGIEPGEIRGSFEGWEEPSEPLGTYLLRSLRRLGDTVVHIYPTSGCELKASAVAARTEAYAHALKEMGVGKGDHVAFVSIGHPENAPLELATLLIGAAWAPINDRFDREDLRRLLAIIQPKVVFTVVSAAETLKGVTGDAPLLLLGEGEAWTQLERRAAEAERRKVPFDPPPVGDLRSARTMLLCSSGTTGLPKVVIYTHFGVHISLQELRHKDAMYKKGDVIISSSPAYWVSGVLFSLSAIVKEYTVVHVSGCTPVEYLGYIEKYKGTTILTANNFLVAVAKQHEGNPVHNLSSLREMFCGGAAMGKDSEEMVERVLGCRVSQVFGMTELCSGMGIASDRLHKFGSVGPCARFLRCRIVDPDSGKPVGRNERGELRFKGPTLTPGYLHNEEATKAAFDEEGWLLSGDIGYVDEDGDFYITGRIKDIIKYRGIHVSPMDIENILDSHPDVIECAVVGVPDPIDQELPRAYVVLRKGATTTAEELCKLVEGKVAEHKWLRGGVIFLDTLPKAAAGKINRTQIRKKYVLEEN